MRAILLAAGLGTRLRPLTNKVPKCLVPVKGQALLEIWFESLIKCGVDSFLVNTHYLSKQVEDFLQKSRFSDNVLIENEEKLLGTAGTLIKHQDFFNQQDGLLIHADNYCLADLSSFLSAHHNRPEHCLITMMVFRSDSPKSCGVVKVDERCVVTEFHEKVNNPPSNLANGAVYILSKEFIKLLNEKFADASDFSTEILPKLVNRIYCYETKEPFLDIGTPESYKKANALAL